MFEMKKLTPEGVPLALEKALRYRMLNEPEQAASICEDVLAIDSANQDALRMLILALTDRFGGTRPVAPKAAQDLLPRLHDAYEREYYAGIICEREAVARLRDNRAHSGSDAFDLFRQAMTHFERAEKLRPPANDDAILRWNSCARTIMNHPDIVPVGDSEELGANLGE